MHLEKTNSEMDMAALNMSGMHDHDAMMNMVSKIRGGIIVI